MTRASLGIWTGAGLALLLAGCSMNDFVTGLVGVQAGPNGDRVVVGSLDIVSRNTEGSLRELGLAVGPQFERDRRPLRRRPTAPDRSRVGIGHVRAARRTASASLRAWPCSKPSPMSDRLQVRPPRRGCRD